MPGTSRKKTGRDAREVAEHGGKRKKESGAFEHAKGSVAADAGQSVCY